MRSSWIVALTLSVCVSAVACDGESETPPAAPTPPTAPVPPKAKAKGKTKAEVAEVAPAPPADPLADAKKAAWGGDASGAATAFGGALDQGPAAWNGLAAAARALDPAAGEAAVDGKGTDGDRAVVVAEIKLAAGDAEGALAAALKARADHPDASAALVARAVKAGAKAPESTGADDPVAALTAFVTAKDARGARAVAETAEAVAGWRAALLRGEAHAAWGEVDAAFAEFEKAVKSEDPMAVIAGNLARVALAGTPKGRAAVAPMQTSQWAFDAAMAAVEHSDVARFNKALEALNDSTKNSLRADLTATATAAALDAAGGTDAVNDHLRLLRASAALGAGEPSVTVAQLQRVAEDSPKREELVRLAMWAYWDLRGTDGLKASGEALSGPHGLAARALHKVLAGNLTEGLADMPTSGLSDRDFVRLTVAGAQVAGPAARDWLQRAVRYADRTGDLGLRIQTRLMLDDATRRHQPAVATKTLAELERLVPEGDAGAALKSELSARRMLLTGIATFPEGDLPPAVKAWRSLSEGQTVTAEGPAVAGIAKWAEARSALGAGQGNAALKFNAAVEALPVYRWGGLATGTALDGSQGVPFAEDLQKLASREPTEDTLGCALAAHEVGHLLDRAVNDASVGRDLLAGMDAQSRTALLEAAALVRSGMTRWLAGVDEFPVAAFEKLEAAEKSASSDSVFSAKVKPSAPPPLSDIRRVNSKLSILSYVIDRGRVQGLVITPKGGAIKDLGESSGVMRNISEHATSLQAGAKAQTRASHNGGNALREALIDPFTQQLSGHGWYLVLGPRELREFMFTTFPEQAKGLRWLAEIRTVSMLDSAARINVTTEDQLDPERFRKGPDILAFGRPAPPVEGEAEPEDAPEPKAKAKAKGKGKGKGKGGADELVEEPEHFCTHGDDPPVNLTVAHRFFDPDFRETCVGPDAKLSSYFELAPRARYIHIDSVDPTSRGGFKFGDGDLELTTVRSIPIVAELVIITAEGTIEQQQQRARAFLDAGAGAVLFTGWSVPEGVHERMLDGFWAAVKRDKPISRANAEGRDSLLRDALLGEDRDNPALWGSMLLYATP